MPDTQLADVDRARRRSRRLELALHVEELAAIESAALAAGHAPAAWVRHVALLRRAPAPRERVAVVNLSEEARALFLQLAPLAADMRGVAANLNQLMRAINEARVAGQVPNLSTAAAAVRLVAHFDVRLDALRGVVDELRRRLIA